MRSFTLISVLIFLFVTTFAQHSIVGHAYDSIAKQPLSYTTVNLLNVDSTLISFSRADADGFFKLTGITKGSYLISASYVGYVPVWKKINVQDSITNIGNLYMQDLKHTDSVHVIAKRPPVVINNDTIEFNTENFKTVPNAVVEDMLKRMPGITIDKDGTVKINGETVKRVLVNGKEFFTGDVTAATKNLPADAVDKVQVYNKQSDQSQLTGIDDGNSEKTINLKLKKDKDHAFFGKLTTGAGTDDRFDAQSNINRMNGNEQLSLLGMSNNTNKQGFTISDMLNFTGELSKGMRNGGGIVIKNSNSDDDNGGLPVTGLGQQQQGIAATTAGGINYNNLWNKGNTDWSSNYIGSNVHLLTDKQTQTQNILPGNDFINNQSSHSITDNTQHHFNLAIDQKFDSSFSLKVTPSITFQHTNKLNNSNYNEVTDNSVQLNNGFNNTSSSADAFNFSNNMLFRKRLKKKGRTLSLNISMNYNHSKQEGSILSDNTLYDNGATIDSSVDQRYNRNAITKNFGSTLIYTEPIGKKSLLEFSGYFNTNIGSSIKNSFDFNTASSKYDVLNSLLSNDFKNNYTYSGGGMDFRTNPGKLNVIVGAQLQSANLKAINNTYHQTVEKNFTDLLPRFILQYNISRLKNLRIEYNTSTTQPSTIQLQPVADITDPLHIVIGNPNLKREYQQSVFMNLFEGNPMLRKSLFTLLNFTSTNNAIVTADSIKQNGTSTRTYLNTNGVYAAFGNIEYGFPLKKLKSRIDIGNSIRFSNNASFVNAQRNTIKTFSVGPNVDYHFDIDNIIDLDVTAQLSINTTKYSLQQFAGNNYWQQTYGVEMTNYFPYNIYLLNDFNYIIYTGRSDGYNTNVPLWNASIAKSFLKNSRGEIKFSVQDLLNKNTGVNRTTNQGIITDERYNVLQRYFLISFTYSLNKSGLKNNGPKAVIKTFNN